MTIKVGINGLGRIGRMVLRSLIESKSNKIQIKHINNRSNLDIVTSLIKYDSIHGNPNFKINNDGRNLIIKGKKITFSQHDELSKINWKKYNVDYVLECTGKFNSKKKIVNTFKKWC